jgi:hypothetical protein
MRNKKRRWDAAVEEDPLAGLVNLFDLWMVFSIALLLALVSYLRLPELLSQPSVAASTTADNSPTDALSRDAQKLDHYRVSNEKLTGEGHRLGTAYRLQTGEVVYVPD